MGLAETDTPTLTTSTGPSTLLVCSLPLALLVHASLFHPGAFRARPWTIAFPAALTAACLAWSRVVSREVPEPYLDEVFHIPQAQKYCEGKFREWDDKITTPPGLYLFSVFLPQLCGKLGIDWQFRCDATSLRAGNVVSLFALAYLALLCRQEIEAQLYGTRLRSPSRPFSTYALHTAFNIALFPLLFFFSGLYYTDVLSTAVVVGAFLNHLKRVARDRSSVASDLFTIAIGLLALLMRQTNVFWIVVFMGGLEAVHAVKTLRPERVDQPFMTTLWAQLKYFAWRYSVGDIHDLPLSHAWHDDMLYTTISLVIAAVCNPLRVVRQVWPYVTVLGCFAAFVAWNGGVVLGDKSNHVATIHLTQMLYIWPFFAFFSLPLLLPYAAPFLSTLNLMFKSQQSQSQFTVPVPSEPRNKPFKVTASSSSKSTSQKQGTEPESIAAKQSQISTALGIAEASKPLSWPLYLIGTVVISGLMVRFNTIIHPFTLADNRHYMFYVFRYTIRRAGWIRYALVLAYTASRWMVWGILAGYSDFSTAFSTVSDGGPYVSYPFWIAYSEKRQTEAKYPAQLPADDSPAGDSQPQRQLADDPFTYSTRTVSTSTGLIFLLATSFSLVTAPLVEPRYFIIPWLMWRLFVPAWRLPDHRSLGGEGTVADRAIRVFRQYDVRLLLETVWFAAINLATCYIFIAKPYVWRAEDGTVLDDGRMQRFMW
ncbi:glucosyltransferase [Purpureocillium lilacinum]|uniref:Dol-P-Glc:Glc(2)Man(9)GlcNAc(2)-PP-Dol alpha-1,2-glucosyltransferase n=1 Tax=Purpureocillium lilacinum TaxID=33203 RepID=A0A179HKC7_PURLI|nr:glucosyltransferase [Purpureocillium lilacinum]OAQ90118.1 glucosyltransferase [Purpureocillium lilacinum]